MLTIRPRTPDDLDECVEVLERVRAADGYPIVWPQDPRSWLGETAVAWIAVIDDRVVGHIALRRDEPAPGVDTIGRFFVDPASSGGGVGRALLEKAVEASGAGELKLSVADNGDRARRLYEAAGWTAMGDEPIEWGGALASRVIRYRLRRR